jgi:hypothetical protein
MKMDTENNVTISESGKVLSWPRLVEGGKDIGLRIYFDLIEGGPMPDVIADMVTKLIPLIDEMGMDESWEIQMKRGQWCATDQYSANRFGWDAARGTWEFIYLPEGYDWYFDFDEELDADTSQSE